MRQVNIILEKKNLKRRIYLGIVVASKQGGGSNEADVVIPHNGVSLFVTWNLERILEHCNISDHRIRVYFWE